jgi:NodT family efflux transporter outer membrane factor (OMF) lipoprotein
MAPEIGTTPDGRVAFLVTRRLALCAGLLLVSGCAVGPNFRLPDLSAPVTYLAGSDATPGVVAAQQESLFWWQSVPDGKLRQLVEAVIAQNADLESAEASVRVAQANAAVARSAFFPTITGSFDASRQKISQETSSALTSNATMYSLHTAALNISYAPDIFGGTRRAYESATSLARAQSFQRDALALTLASNTAVAAVQEASLQQQITVTRNMVQIQQQLLNLLNRQNAAGQISYADVAAQETALAQTRLLLPPLEKQLEQNRNLLATLSGRFPAEAQLPSFALSDFRKLPAVPLTATGDLIRQRPDIRAAEARLQSANAQIGVAIANRLPGITLSGQVGSSSSALDKLFNPGMGLWSVAGGVLQPIFDAGALANRQEAAEEGMRQALADYRSTVLNAFQNVADALRALQADEKSIRAAQTATAAANRNLSLVRKQVESGQVSAPALISAQQAYLQTSLALVQAQASRQANVFALVQALGGGWWPPKDATVTVVAHDTEQDDG